MASSHPEGSDVQVLDKVGQQLQLIKEQEEEVLKFWESLPSNMKDRLINKEKAKIAVEDPFDPFVTPALPRKPGRPEPTNLFGVQQNPVQRNGASNPFLQPQANYAPPVPHRAGNPPVVSQQAGALPAVSQAAAPPAAVPSTGVPQVPLPQVGTSPVVMPQTGIPPVAMTQQNIPMAPAFQPGVSPQVMHPVNQQAYQTPSMAPTILPDFKSMDDFANGPGESWDNFIEKWEIKMRPYKFPSDQLALALPDRFRGSAYTKYKRLIKERQECLTNYYILRQELDKIFRAHINLQGRGLYTIQQGRRTVGEYYSEIAALADTAYNDVPEEYRDTFLVDIFIQGLRDPIRRSFSSKGKLTLKQAVHEAEVAELGELYSSKSAPKVNAVNAINLNDTLQSFIEPLKRQVSDLKHLFEKQASAKVSNGDGRNKPRQTVQNSQSRPSGQNNSSDSSTKPKSNEPKNKNKPSHYKKNGKNSDKPRGVCWICSSPEHYANRCPRKVNSIAVVSDDLDPNQYAEMYLTQTEQPEEAEINSVDSSKPSGRGKKFSSKDYFSLTLMMILTLISSASCASIVLPDNPMVCGSTPSASHIYNISHNYGCTSNQTNSNRTVPQAMTLQIYKQNIVEWQTKAYQCSKYKQIITTSISFLSDVKTKTASTERQTVSREECERMITHRSCSAGELVGGHGVLVTQNTVNASYKYCCKKHSFEANQCSVIETAVLKRHGEHDFESPAGDVSHCSYDSGSCLLSDQSILLWEQSKASYCKFEPWYIVEGKLYQDHFVSKNRDFALTFKQHGFLSTKDCNSNITSLSDQGLMVRFLTPLKITLLKTAVEANYTATGRSSGVINAMVQSVVINERDIIIEQFWNTYYYTCHGLSQTLKIVTLLMEKHPTMSARYMLQNPYITASIGPGVLEVFPCTQLNHNLYEILPMSAGNCTNYIPIKIMMGGSSHIGYLDPVENVVYKDTHTVDCAHMQNTIVRLNGSAFQYSFDGTLTPLTNISRLKLPDIRLGAHPIVMHESIYSNAHLINWQDFSNHHSLNTLLATLDRQRQVLEAMGVHSSRFETLDHNVIESKESILGNSLFAFLFGGHVASGYELWTFGCNIVVTVVGSIIILMKLRQRCCPNFKINIPQFRTGNPVIANVEVDTDDEGSVNCECANNDDPTTVPLQSRSTQFQIERECQTSPQRSLLTPTAPTESSVDVACPVPRLYPNLPVEQPEPVNIVWPSFYRRYMS